MTWCMKGNQECPKTSFLSPSRWSTGIWYVCSSELRTFLKPGRSSDKFYRSFISFFWVSFFLCGAAFNIRSCCVECCSRNWKGTGLKCMYLIWEIKQTQIKHKTRYMCTKRRITRSHKTYEKCWVCYKVYISVSAFVFNIGVINSIKLGNSSSFTLHFI